VDVLPYWRDVWEKQHAGDLSTNRRKMTPYQTTRLEVLIFQKNWPAQQKIKQWLICSPSKTLQLVSKELDHEMLGKSRKKFLKRYPYSVARKLPKNCSRSIVGRRQQAAEYSLRSEDAFAEKSGAASKGG